jgi:hypothetical protein
MLKNLFKRKNKPELSPVKDKLIHLFKGSDGRDYYGFKVDSDLPLARFEVQLMLLEHMRAGMTGEEITTILDNIDMLVAEMVKASDKDRPSYGAKIGTMTTIARARMSNSLHHELLLSMAAIWVVRDDEDPIKYNQDIHDQKRTFFAAECKEGSAYDFFQRTGFAGLPTYIQLSESELNELWSNSISQQKMLAENIERLILRNLPRLLSKTGKPN